MIDMDIGGIFSNWGKWSPDPERNEAMNQALTLFGASMLKGSGSGQNFSSIMGDAVGTAQGAYNDSRDRGMKRRYMQAQIDEQASQAEYRRAQMEELLRKARAEANKLALRSQVYSGTQPAIDMGMAQAFGRQEQYNPEAGMVAGPQTPDVSLSPRDVVRDVPKLMPTFDDVRRLAQADALDSKDIDLAKLGAFGQPTPAGSYTQSPEGGSRYFPKPGEPSITADGRVFNPPGTLTAIGDQTLATETAKRTAETNSAFGRAYGTASGQGAGAAPYELVDIQTPDGRTMKVPRSAVLGMQPQGGQPGGQPGVMSGMTTDTQQRNESRATFNREWVTKTLPAVQKEGLTARSTINQMDALATLNLRTGWGTETLATLGNVLGAFGIAPDRLAGITTAAQVFQKFASDGVLLAQIAQAGPQTESDARRMAMTLPSLSNSADANALIMAYIKAGAEKQVAKAKFYQAAYEQYTRGVGTLDQIDSAWQQAAPSLWSMPSMSAWQSRYPNAPGSQSEIPR